MDVNTSVNSTALNNSSLLTPYISSLDIVTCFKSTEHVIIFSSYVATYFSFLPMLIFILYLGYQQWRQQRSVPTATASHSDVFTYHSIAMQMSEIFGATICLAGSYVNRPNMVLGGIYTASASYLGQNLFHLLTCVERYVAVVHPVTYLGLRQGRGVKIRNIIIGCVWLVSSGWVFAWLIPISDFHFIVELCLMVFFLSIISFCSISVLCVLKRPGPGEVGGKGKRVDQTKQRAFNTIMAIMGTLLLRFAANLLFSVAVSSASFNSESKCSVLFAAMWCGLPSSLVLPLLFLHRAGKLQCCKGNNESG